MSEMNDDGLLSDSSFPLKAISLPDPSVLQSLTSDPLTHLDQLTTQCDNAQSTAQLHNPLTQSLTPTNTTTFLDDRSPQLLTPLRFDQLQLHTTPPSANSSALSSALSSARSSPLSSPHTLTRSTTRTTTPSLLAEADKRPRRRQQNRDAAATSRLRKKLHLQHLENIIQLNGHQMMRMREEMERVQRENEELRHRLAHYEQSTSDVNRQPPPPSQQTQPSQQQRVSIPTLSHRRSATDLTTSLKHESDSALMHRLSTQAAAAASMQYDPLATATQSLLSRYSLGLPLHATSFTSSLHDQQQQLQLEVLRRQRELQQLHAEQARLTRAATLPLEMQHSLNNRFPTFEQTEQQVNTLRDVNNRPNSFLYQNNNEVLQQFQQQRQLAEQQTREQLHQHQHQHHHHHQQHHQQQQQQTIDKVKSETEKHNQTLEQRQ